MGSTLIFQILSFNQIDNFLNIFKELVYSLTQDFEAHAQKTEEGVEFWLARDLQKLLGYEEWRNFLAVIEKAKMACET